MTRHPFNSTYQVKRWTLPVNKFTYWTRFKSNRVTANDNFPQRQGETA